ncbi:MAG: hypothetical protein ACJ763_19830 [Bdellovibrionia bacterium]
MSRHQRLAFIFSGLSLVLLSVYESPVSAITCYRERHMYNGGSCAQDMGLGGTDNTTVATGADCAAFCDGSCNQICTDPFAFCSFTYENCTY